ncbi:uncharacterized protein LOC133825674 [Humulus lupulus]|uniref:uncharacterized protein LOC133825674 n=1 Tax=Humulus lupulus TaxID=3486 RepID=UPI002B417D60|nr:uncharacterized protein LOC133825674 [Humulus lupulus]
MSKAYDIVEWKFVEVMMCYLGYEEDWICKIMNCVCRISFSILLNGEVRGSVTSQQGLRQGDPLSPYLFLLCFEGLSCLIHEAERQGKITGVHFGKIGQKINLEKSEVCVGKSIFQEEARNLAIFLGVTLADCHPKYLGMSTFVGKRKKEVFSMIKQKIWNNLRGGKPISSLKRIHAMAAQLWWGYSLHKKKIHWGSWEKLCKENEKGGLGFRSLEDFNRAFLAKQGWNLLSKPSSLLAYILKECYFVNRDFLNAKNNSYSSVIWRSILWGCEVLKKGFVGVFKMGLRLESMRIVGCPTRRLLICESKLLFLQTRWCHCKSETIIHALWECQSVKKIWDSVNLLQLFPHNSLDHFDFALSVWSHCSKHVFLLLTDFKREGNSRSKRENFKWQAPPLGTIRIDCDASLGRDSMGCGIGVVARDHGGKVIASQSVYKPGISSVELAKSLAIQLGFQLAWKLRLHSFQLFSDCAAVKKALNCTDTTTTNWSSVINTIKESPMFTLCSLVVHSFKEANRVAHIISKLACTKIVSDLWVGSVPDCASALIQAELP